MRKKILCGFLCAGLFLGSALAAESGFADVKDSDWYAPYVAVCVENGLMNGTGGGNFNPGGTISVAEVAAIAARLGSSNTGSSISPVGSGAAWYTPYLDYLKSYGVTVDNAEVPATRQDFISFLAAVTPPEQLTVINAINTLPDTDDRNVLAFYNAGILTGVDRQGTFAGDKTLTRSEAAAMVSRVVDSSLRLSFVPVQPTPAVSPAENLGGDTVMTVNGQAVPRSELEYWITAVAYHIDASLYSYYDLRLDLNDAERVQGVLAEARQQTILYALLSQQAANLGCQVEDLPAAFTPSPTTQELEGYVKENDLLCAKHILVADPQTAQAVLDGLESVPTLEQFNALLYVFGTDPGMTEYPDGYLFGPGEMVEEFEAGTRALDIGTYTTEPVQSQFGYHIIWRLDPVGHPDLLAEYQEGALDQALEGWYQTAQVQADEAAIAQIDVAAVYRAYLESLRAEQ